MTHSIYESENVGVQQLKGPAVEDFKRSPEKNRGGDVDNTAWKESLSKVKEAFNKAHDDL